MKFVFDHCKCPRCGQEFYCGAIRILSCQDIIGENVYNICGLCPTCESEVYFTARLVMEERDIHSSPHVTCDCCGKPINLIKTPSHVMDRIPYWHTCTCPHCHRFIAFTKSDIYNVEEDHKMTKVERHMNICKGLNTTYADKNHDYGDAFHVTFLEEGFAMARIRLTDKLERFKALTKNRAEQKVKDESVRDTLLDMANYAIMTVMEMDLEKENMETAYGPNCPVVTLRKE